VPFLDHIGYLFLIPSNKTSNLFFLFLNKEFGFEPKPHLPQIGSSQNKRGTGGAQRPRFEIRINCAYTLSFDPSPANRRGMPSHSQNTAKII
jgi:hypothetical protein